MTEPIAAVVLSSSSRRSHALNAYVSTEKAGQAEGERFVAASGINGCIPELAEKQMRDNRKRWGKNGTRVVDGPTGKITEGQYVQAYHVIQSFARDGLGALDPDDPNDWEKAHELGVQLARDVAGKTRLATVYTQIDGNSGCVHNHIVIDSIEKTTGRSFDSSNVNHKILVERHDRMLAENGYEQVNEYPQEGTTKSAEKVEKSELRGLAKHQQWEAGDRKEPEPFSVAVLKSRIRSALADDSFTTFDEFVDVANDHDVEVEQRGESGRGITYAMQRLERWEKDEYLPVSKSDRRRASKLGRDFMMDAVEAAIQRNLALAKQRQADRTAPKPQEAQEAQEAQTTVTAKPGGKVPSEAEPRQLARRTTKVPDISADVNRQMAESGSAAEALLREFEATSHRRKTDSAAPEEHHERELATQPSVEPRDDETEDTAPVAPARAREDDEEVAEDTPTSAPIVTPARFPEGEVASTVVTAPEKAADDAGVGEVASRTEHEPDQRVQGQQIKTGPKRKPQWLLDIIEQEAEAEPEQENGPSLG